ncbi:MAG: DUF202 domain-containing protein [Thermoanaerobaculia bacterium]|nr:DUF202 domain-containing protein [Thermoanaerobaculia bacterium]
MTPDTETGDLEALRSSDSTERRTELALSRTVLAAERTFTAWVKTAIGFLAGGLGLARLMQAELEGPHGLLILGASFLMVVVAMVIAVHAMQRYRQRTGELGSQALGRWSPRVVVFIGASLVVVGIAALICLWRL